MSSVINDRSDSRTEDERSSHKGDLNKEQQFTEDDLAIFHERESGRVILDPEEARIEFGEEFTSRLKLTKDGKTILWPQPRDDPADPQNWSNRKKAIHLGIVTLATVIPDFDSAIGIASVFQLAKEYNTTTGHINNLTSNWSIFLIGWGGFFDIMLMRRYGRLSVLFWTQLLALGFLVGATFAPTLEVFAAMRCLTGFFGTCPQITGLFVINDIFPFHLRARKIGIWTCAAVLGPHLSPFVFSFLVGRINYRWAWGIGCMYGLIVLLLIVFFVEETIYDRKLGVSTVEPGLKGRVKSLIGMNASKISKTAPPWKEIFIAPFAIVWRPHFFGICLLEAMIFGFSIGVNITNTIFFQSPPPFGFGFEPFTVAGIYATPVIAVFVGEVFGRYLNDWVMYTTVRRNQGVFEAEARLWTCYLAIPLFLCGFLVLGAALQHHLHIAVIVVGWGIAQVATLMCTVAVYAYSNDCFPRRQGEVSAVINLVRVLGGFSVAYYQVPWSEKNGAMQTLGLEAGIVCALFVLIVPALQLKGRELRRRFSIE